MNKRLLARELIWSSNRIIRKNVATDILQEISKNFVSNGQYPHYEISVDQFDTLRKKYGAEVKNEKLSTM